MQIEKIEIKNFRLLRDIHLSLEGETTVIVGRNNSGKTSITELFRRLFSENSPSFALEDFSLSSHADFWNAYCAWKNKEDENKIRTLLPAIEIKIFIQYKLDDPNFNSFGEFIIDLDTNSSQAILNLQYRLKDGRIKLLFEDIIIEQDWDLSKQKKYFFKRIKERLSSLFSTAAQAIDPNDFENRKDIDLSSIRNSIQINFISAQRGLDDITNKDRDNLAKLLERLFNSASSENAIESDRETVSSLEKSVQEIQEKIDIDFNKKLDNLFPAFNKFGYPRFKDPKLQTETTLNLKRILETQTKVRYEGLNGINLPESYNGLGSRNLLYILLQLLEFFKSYKSKSNRPGNQIVFIEEPEAHLHPQMQTVFIRQLNEMSKELSKLYENEEPWPIQFIVTTHSIHIANEAPFEQIRYFLSNANDNAEIKIKDLRSGLSGETWEEDSKFLHEYLTLTRCDLFFADKAILIEGTSERILMPKMIEKIDKTLDENKKLLNQYISVIEVGGAYAHKFFALLDFLELQTLIITDIDSVDKNRKKCKVIEGSDTSNYTIKNWFAEETKTESKTLIPTSLIEKKEAEKIKQLKRIAYQIPEENSKACPRSFEDALILANPKLFEIDNLKDPEKADAAWEKAKNITKTDFALEHAIYKTDWEVPKYITEALEWLSSDVNKKIPIPELKQTKKNPKKAPNARIPKRKTKTNK